ncbi:MAG: hypothetical protein IEMM0003_0299 [bacterium]|nr:MAG: hypothetical protein IEMM0003_0299 [bacterium]
MIKKTETKQLLCHIYDLYDELVRFLYDAAKKVVSGDKIDYSRMGHIKENLAESILQMRSFDTEKFSILKDSELYNDVSRLKKKIELYNKVSENFVVLISDSVQFYNSLLQTNDSLYNDRGIFSSNLPKAISVKA